MDPEFFLNEIGQEIEKNFWQNRRIMSFDQYLELFFSSPYRFVRNAAQYTLDMIDHFGVEERITPLGKVRRFKVFDVPFLKGRGRMIAQEEAQNALYRTLLNFATERKVSKLILLHGPNGSAKSTLISCLMRGLEYYSHTDEGALYKFNWIFPSEKISRGGIGFKSLDGKEVSGEYSSYAFLEEKDIAVKLPDELKDNPLLLLPQDLRARLFEEAFKDQMDRERRYAIPDTMMYGDLNHKNKQIYETLLNAYRGDWRKVLRHVQIERFYISAKYRQSAVTIEPQGWVDASTQQITVDRSLSALPPSLQNLALHETKGDLIDANRGLIEFSDLLKRSVDSFIYLLGTSEKGIVNLPNAVVFLDILMVASANDQQIEEFKKTPIFTSFKGRMELIRMPYILDFLEEEKIYADQTELLTREKPMAPHTTEVAALWAVLTRLKKPIDERYTPPLSNIVRKLKPLEKALLYAKGEVPDHFSEEEKKILRANIDQLWTESSGYPNYEGKLGASAREIKTILLNAAQNPKYRCLSPLPVFEELEAFVKDPSVYDFLQVEVRDGYHDSVKFIDTVREYYLDILDREVVSSMQLVEESQYRDLFEKYVFHVSHWVKKEKIRNPVTGAREEPNETLMNDVEKILGVSEERKEFRNDIIQRIGAYSLDHPNEKVDYTEIFSDLFQRMEENFYHERKKAITRITENILRYSTDEASLLSDADRKQVEETLAQMKERYGYCETCAREVISFLKQHRYD
ncbi:MAG: serine protein kinase PrkA [Deltaproteobacteria bacterium]|nr:MAG: serine protein kinase PrkA [Deltaproteobacteria bacterium]